MRSNLWKWGELWAPRVYREMARCRSIWSVPCYLVSVYMLYHVYVINKNSYSTLSRGIPWSIPLVTRVISWNTHEPLTHGENTSEKWKYKGIPWYITRKCSTTSVYVQDAGTWSPNESSKKPFDVSRRCQVICLLFLRNQLHKYSLLNTITFSHQYTGPSWLDNYYYIHKLFSQLAWFVWRWIQFAIFQTGLSISKAF